MKRVNLSISFLYFLSAVFVILFIVVPFFIWSYYDTKKQTQKNINSYFKQSVSIVETILENKIDNLETTLNYLLENIDDDVENKLQKIQQSNFDILFFKSNSNKVLNYSNNFLYDTDKIVNEIVKQNNIESKYIHNIKINKNIFTVIINYKKVINKKTGRVEGLIVAGDILNNNLSFVNTIVRKTSLENIALRYDRTPIVTNINQNFPIYNFLNMVFKDDSYKEIQNSLVFSKYLTIKNTNTKNNIVFVDDNKIIKSLQKSFIEKNILMAVLIFIAFFLGFFLTRKYIIKPIELLKNFNNKNKTSKTIVKDVNDIANSLYETLQSLDEYKKAIDTSSIVSKSDINGIIVYVNDRFCEVTGYEKDEVIGKSHNILRDKNVPKTLFKNMWNKIKVEKKPYIGYLSNKKKNGELFYTKVTITPILDKKENIVEFLALREDITELIKSKEKLQSAYTTDSLTKLPNRYQLTMDLDDNTKYNLILINIDSFSEVNDFYGNDIGDEILKLFTKKIQEYFDSKEYKIYRVYGDEFAVTVSQDVLNVEDLLFGVNIFINHIEASPFIIGDVNINLRVTCGISLVDKTDTFVHADLALKSARKDKKDCEIYSDNNSVLKEHKNNLYWTHEIKTALAEDRIETFYQPIKNNLTKRIEKYESLVRLITKDGEVISPFFFLDIAKKTKLYNQITKVVIQKSFTFFENKPYEFSINLTIDDILNPEIMLFLKEKIKKHNYKNRIVLEIVESEQIENFGVVSKFIDEFKELGCKIAIDDFGTGYSNFEYLMRLNVDYIKIDGSLIKNILEDKNSYSVVETIVSFAKKSKLKTIAEFVSSKQIQNRIDHLNIDYSQGYYLGEPQKDLIQ